MANKPKFTHKAKMTRPEPEEKGEKKFKPTPPARSVHTEPEHKTEKKEGPKMSAPAESGHAAKKKGLGDIVKYVVLGIVGLIIVFTIWDNWPKASPSAPTPAVQQQAAPQAGAGAQSPTTQEPLSIQQERARLKRRYDELERHDDMAPHWEPVDRRR